MENYEDEILLDSIFKQPNQKKVYAKGNTRKNTFRKRDKLSKAAIGIAAVAVTFAVSAIGVVSFYLIDQNAANAKEAYQYEYIYNLMLKSSDGKIMKLPVEKNKPIGVVLDDFTNEEEQVVKSAINELDEISETINYIFLTPEEAKMHPNSIYIYNNADLSNHKHKVENTTTKGLTVFASVPLEKESKMLFPINISLTASLNETSKRDTTMLSYVVKHEMMHTLGFADIYNTSQKNETIMYYACNAGHITTYTERDKSIIRQVYDSQMEITKDTPVQRGFFKNIDAITKDQYVGKEI